MSGAYNLAYAPPVDEVEFRGEYITLGQLLKLAGLVETGGDAKHLLAEGDVAVNGETEGRRGRKLRHCDVVAVVGRGTIRVVARDPATEIGS